MKKSSYSTITNIITVILLICLFAGAIGACVKLIQNIDGEKDSDSSVISSVTLNPASVVFSQVDETDKVQYLSLNVNTYAVSDSDGGGFTISDSVGNEQLILIMAGSPLTLSYDDVFAAGTITLAFGKCYGTLTVGVYEGDTLIDSPEVYSGETIELYLPYSSEGYTVTATLT